MGTAASVAGALDMNGGTLTLSDSTNTAYSIGKLLGSGNLAIDFGTTGSDSIAMTSSDETARTITLTALNGLPTTGGSAISAQTILSGATDNITLAVSDALRAIYDRTDVTGSGYDSDTIISNALWTTEFKNRYYEIETGKQLVVDNSKSNKTLAYDWSEQKIYDPTKDVSLGDTLMLVNTKEDTTRTFTTTDQNATYSATTKILLPQIRIFR